MSESNNIPSTIEVNMTKDDPSSSKPEAKTVVEKPPSTEGVPDVPDVKKVEETNVTTTNDTKTEPPPPPTDTKTEPPPPSTDTKKTESPPPPPPPAATNAKTEEKPKAVKQNSSVMVLAMQANDAQQKLQSEQIMDLKIKEREARAEAEKYKNELESLRENLLTVNLNDDDGDEYMDDMERLKKSLLASQLECDELRQQLSKAMNDLKEEREKNGSGGGKVTSGGDGDEKGMGTKLGAMLRKVWCI